MLKDVWQKNSLGKKSLISNQGAKKVKQRSLPYRNSTLAGRFASTAYILTTLITIFCLESANFLCHY